MYCTHTCIHTCIYARTRACIHICTHASMNACMHACVHAYMHAYMHACMGHSKCWRLSAAPLPLLADQILGRYPGRSIFAHASCFMQYIHKHLGLSDRMESGVCVCCETCLREETTKIPPCLWGPVFGGPCPTSSGCPHKGPDTGIPGGVCLPSTPDTSVDVGCGDLSSEAPAPPSGRPHKGPDQGTSDNEERLVAENLVQDNHKADP